MGQRKRSKQIVRNPSLQRIWPLAQVGVSSQQNNINDRQPPPQRSTPSAAASVRKECFSGDMPAVLNCYFKELEVRKSHAARKKRRNWVPDSNPTFSPAEESLCFVCELTWTSKDGNSEPQTSGCLVVTG